MVIYANLPPLQLRSQDRDLPKIVIPVYLFRHSAVGMLHGQLFLLLKPFLLHVNLLDLVLLLINVIQLSVGISVHLIRVSVVALLLIYRRDVVMVGFF